MKHLIAVILAVLITAGALLCVFLPRQEKAGEELERMAGELSALSEQSAWLEELCTLAGEENLGYANEYFRSDRSVMVLRSGGKPEELKLTANWKGGGSVDVDCSGDAAELRFREEEWDCYTTLLVTPQHPGITVARFSSDAQETGFAVWILVKE